MGYASDPAWWSQHTALADTDTDLVSASTEAFVVVAEHTTARELISGYREVEDSGRSCAGDYAWAIRSPDDRHTDRRWYFGDHVYIIRDIIYGKELVMAVTSVDLDPRLIERARKLTGERSNRAVLDLALRRLIASRQKGAMIDGIAELTDLPEGLGAPIDPPVTSPRD